MVLRSIEVKETSQAYSGRTLCKGFIIPAKPGGTVAIYDEVVDKGESPESDPVFTFATGSRVDLVLGSNDSYHFCNGIYVVMTTADDMYFLVP